jgi:hypothetical protein
MHDILDKATMTHTAKLVALCDRQNPWRMMVYGDLCLD